MRRRVLLEVAGHMFRGGWVDDDCAVEFGIEGGIGQFGLEHQVLGAPLLHVAEVNLVALRLTSNLVAHVVFTVLL